MKNTFLLLLTITAQFVFAQTDQELADQSVNKSIIRSHIGFLASDELKGRDTPSEGQNIAAKYIQSRFIEYDVQMVEGMDSYFQAVPMKSVKAPTTGAIKVGGEEYKITEDFFLINEGKSLFDVPMIFVEYGTEADLEKAKIEGKLVFALCGDGESQNPQEWLSISSEKRKKIIEKGGVGLVELYNSSQIPWNLLVRYFNRDQTILDEGDASSSIVHVWMNRSLDDLSAMKKKKTKGSVVIEEIKTSRFVTKNIVGMVEGTDPALKNEFVVYSAHYDHVGIGKANAEGDSIYNGARDNAVGTVTVLSAAKSIAKNPTKRSALFVLFTGEEKGLLGSKAFVDNSPIALEKMVYCFNSDNAGYNDTSLATIIGLGRTTADQMIMKACETFGLKATDDPAPEQGLFDRSDNVRFAAKGIPAPTFSLGFTAFDAEIGKYYHQPSDDSESLDYDYLEKFFKSYVYACRMIGNADETPFWVEGDKYYDQGVKLYGK